MEILFIAIVVLLILSGVLISGRGRRSGAHSKTSQNRQRPADYVDTTEFDSWKSRISKSCREEEFDDFFRFLQRYKGGYIRRKNGQIVLQEYKNSEKGDLKGIFFNVIVPSKISTGRKEQLRQYLISVGVDGLLDRPDYEGRDGKLSLKDLSGNALAGDELEMKRSGNRGESLVRRKLEELSDNDFKVLNGVVLRKDGITKEYDHIIIGKTGVFSLETKAFGLKGSDSDRTQDKAASINDTIYVNKEDEWTIQKRNGNKKFSHDLPCPTQQISEEKQFLEDILAEYLIEVHPVLVLANEQVRFNSAAEHEYDVVNVRKLKNYITQYPDQLNEGDRMMGLQMIVERRIN